MAPFPLLLLIICPHLDFQSELLVTVPLGLHYNYL